MASSCARNITGGDFFNGIEIPSTGVGAEPLDDSELGKAMNIVKPKLQPQPVGNRGGNTRTKKYAGIVKIRREIQLITLINQKVIDLAERNLKRVSSLENFIDELIADNKNSYQELELCKCQLVASHLQIKWLEHIYNRLANGTEEGSNYDPNEDNNVQAPETEASEESELIGGPFGDYNLKNTVRRPSPQNAFPRNRL